MVSFLIVFNLFVVSFAFFILYFYLKATNSEFNAFPLGLIVLLATVATLGRKFWLLRLRFERKSIQYFIISIIFTLFNVGLGILFVVYYQMGAVGKLLPAFLIDFIIFLIFFVKFVQNIKIDFIIVRKALNFCFPIILSALLNLPILTLDKIILERVNNINEFAYYNLAFGFAGYVYTFINAISMTLEPDVYKLVGEKNKKKLRQIFFLLLFLVILSNIIFISFSKPVIYFLTAGRYMGAVKYANLLVIAESSIALVYFFDSILIALKITRIELIVMLIVAIISIGSLLPFISSFEYFGAIYSKILTYFIWIGLLAIAIIFRNSKFMQHFYIR